MDAIDIMGGETLLHPNIAELTEFFVNDNRCGKVTIISNGTILPNDRLTNVMKSRKVVFRLSDYGQLSRKKEEIIKLFDSEDIKYELTNYPYWDKIPIIEKQNETLHQVQAKYSTCTANVLYIKHGKLFQCRFVTGLSDLDANMIPDFEKNYVNLLALDKKIVSSQIKEFIQQLYSRIPLDACKYYPGGHCILFGQHVPVAEQARGKLPLDLLYKDGVRPCD